jgi:hypothetical protein
MPLESRLNIKLLAALAFSAPLAAVAAEPLDMSCGLTVTAFFAPLIQKALIDPRAVKVAPASSINYFKPRFLKKMTVYGMPVTSVFGYTDDPLFFRKVSESKQDVYGVVVREGIGNVTAQLASVSATQARPFRIDSSSTLILCKGEM